MKHRIENLKGNALVWASATSKGWETTNSESLRRIRIEGGEEVEDLLMPGDLYPDTIAEISTLRDKHGDEIDIPAAWS